MSVTEALDIPAGFADRLRAALKHAKLTHEQIAAALVVRMGTPVARTTVTHWCTARSEPDRDQIEVIAEETGVNPSWLAWGRGEMVADDLAAANAAPAPADVAEVPTVAA